MDIWIKIALFGLVVAPTQYFLMVNALFKEADTRVYWSN